MAKRAKRTADPSTVVGYIRVSTDEQAESGLGLAAQRAAIEAEVARRGWTLIAVHEDAGVSGKSLKGREGLSAALSEVNQSLPFHTVGRSVGSQRRRAEQQDIGPRHLRF